LTEERLQKILAQAGFGSRRKCEELIRSGTVQVNGRIVTELGTRVDPQRDKVTVNGQLIKPEEKVYIALYKPLGYVTTLFDPERRRTVKDLVRNIPQRVYPVGRLDYDTEGLLLMTNDGALAYALTHPKHHVPKTYVATVLGKPGPSALKQLARGVRLSDGPTAPARVRLLKAGTLESVLEITIHEGRNRQVRRMCEAVGHPVRALRRVRFGNIKLGSLQPGQFRKLTKTELKRLRMLSGLSS